MPLIFTAVKPVDDQISSVETGVCAVRHQSGIDGGISSKEQGFDLKLSLHIENAGTVNGDQTVKLVLRPLLVVNVFRIEDIIITCIRDNACSGEIQRSAVFNCNSTGTGEVFEADIGSGNETDKTAL